MSQGVQRGSNYGKLGRLANTKAYEIWHTRNNELTPCEFAEPPPDDYQPFNFDAILARQLMEQIEGRLTQREMLVLLGHHVVGWSFNELGAKMNLSRARVAQIEKAAIRKARHGFQHGDDCWTN